MYAPQLDDGFLYAVDQCPLLLPHPQAASTHEQLIDVQAILTCTEARARQLSAHHKAQQEVTESQRSQMDKLQAAGKQLRAEGEALKKELGDVECALADAVREVEAGRGERQVLAAQLEEVRQQYHITGGWVWVLWAGNKGIHACFVMYAQQVCEKQQRGLDGSSNRPTLQC